MEGTCHAPLITVNASPAAVYRAIGSDIPPTLLVDEADTIFGGKNAEANEDLRGLLNAGHQRNRPAIRWDNATRSLETIPTFAMAALAGIGAMPDTIEDRAVVIRMRRRAPGETVAPFRHRRDRPALTNLAAELARWLGAHLAELERAEPVMPLEDRAADTWEPLIAVADLAAGEWPALARHAAVVLTADRDQAADLSDRIRLLADCRTAFGDADALPTTTLVTRLRSDPEAPWCDHGPAGITPKRLGGPAGRLRHPVRQHPVPRADRPSEGLLPGRLHRRMGAVLPAPGGGAVPAVPSVPAQLRPGTARNVGRLSVQRSTAQTINGTDRSVPPKQPSQG